MSPDCSRKRRHHGLLSSDRSWISGKQFLTFFRENRLHEALLCLPSGFDPRLCVDLDRITGAGMAHKFLDNLYVLAIRDY